MLKSLSASLVISAFAFGAQAKPILITAFPYTIVAPGNYQVGTVIQTGPGTSITINCQIPGKVVLDLNNASLKPDPLSSKNGPASDCIDVFSGSDITIENGAVSGGLYLFATGIYVNAGATGPYLDGAFETDPLLFSPSGNPSTGAGIGIGSLTINNVAVRSDPYGIILVGISGATIKNCTFLAPEGPVIGIWDYASRSGNTYKNNSFNEVENPFIVSAGTSSHGNTYSETIVQQRSVFATPAPTPNP